jgi:hypothetical protein
MTGRDGAERYPQAGELSLAAAVTRSLRQLDSSVSLAWVEDVIAPVEALSGEAEVLRARDVTLQSRPDNVKEFFRAQFRAVVAPRVAVPRAPAPAPLKSSPGDDPYGF